MFIHTNQKRSQVKKAMEADLVLLLRQGFIVLLVLGSVSGNLHQVSKFFFFSN
jgi:hypothetical protein